MNQFSLHIELQPTPDFTPRDLIIQSSWGLKCKFWGIGYWVNE